MADKSSFEIRDLRNTSESESHVGFKTGLSNPTTPLGNNNKYQRTGCSKVELKWNTLAMCDSMGWMGDGRGTRIHGNAMIK